MDGSSRSPSFLFDVVHDDSTVRTAAANDTPVHISLQRKNLIKTKLRSYHYVLHVHSRPKDLPQSAAVSSNHTTSRTLSMRSPQIFNAEASPNSSPQPPTLYTLARAHSPPRRPHLPPLTRTPSNLASSASTISSPPARALSRSASPFCPNVAAPNEYGGWHTNPSNSMFSSGDFDPWRALSPKANLPHRASVQTRSRHAMGRRRRTRSSGWCTAIWCACRMGGRC